MLEEISNSRGVLLLFANSGLLHDWYNGRDGRTGYRLTNEADLQKRLKKILNRNKSTLQCPRKDRLNDGR